VLLIGFALFKAECYSTRRKGNIILSGLFARKVVRFLSSAIVYIISPIRKNLVNARVNMALVLISNSNGPYITT